MDLSDFKNPGTCQFCFGTFESTSMARHVGACPSRRMLLSEIKPRFPDAPTVFHMAAQRTDQPDVWIHFEIEAQASLAALDLFLQDALMEQSGRPSAFRIRRKLYSAQEAAGVRVGKALKPGQTFRYEYSLDDVTIPLQLKIHRRSTTSAMNLNAVLTAKSKGIRSTFFQKRFGDTMIDG